MAFALLSAVPRLGGSAVPVEDRAISHTTTTRCASARPSQPSIASDRASCSSSSGVVAAVVAARACISHPARDAGSEPQSSLHPRLLSVDTRFVEAPKLSPGVDPYGVPETQRDECVAVAVQGRRPVRALAASVPAWVDQVPGLLADLSEAWELSYGDVFERATEALVIAATRVDGTAAVVKLAVPRTDQSFDREAMVLRLARGDGCAQLIDFDADRGAILMERLGPTLASLDLPIDQRDDILCATAARLWRAIPSDSFPSGADSARSSIEYISRLWEETDRPCSERAVAHALACAERRIVAHDEARSVLVHGDVHQWNTLQDGGDFSLIDPDGMHAEPEYDLGSIMRLQAFPLIPGGPQARARRLSVRTGLNETAIWEWGAVARVRTGLLLVSLLMPDGTYILSVADQVAD